ncbi:EID1-like F-box protein 3 [Nymphaea thermarum]|nr:EID1-like F-box protein 3 [Nymphaea thermarum]
MELQVQTDSRRLPENDSGSESGLLDERVLLLVFRSINWNPQTLCAAACVSRKLDAVAKRMLWRELCAARAPRMVAELTRSSGRVAGGWLALAKLFLFCCGARPSRHFDAEAVTPGHFAEATRFSKTSGRSFLARHCWGDLLYVSDPCEHGAASSGGNDVGVYRGVFGSFANSRTRQWILSRRVGLEAGVNCPYCRASVWSMTEARFVPRSASRRLGSHHGSVEYFVCVNGHLHGSSVQRR